jgi:hypothetical protein
MYFPWQTKGIPSFDRDAFEVENQAREINTDRVTPWLDGSTL